MLLFFFTSLYKKGRKPGKEKERREREGRGKENVGHRPAFGVVELDSSFSPLEEMEGEKEKRKKKGGIFLVPLSRNEVKRREKRNSPPGEKKRGGR